MKAKLVRESLYEGAFNDAGEPMMTHNQYRDYSEPAEDEYDDANGHDYEREQNDSDVVKAIESYFNTILETYDGEEYMFLTKNVPNHDINGDLMLYIQNNIISAYAIGNEFPEINIEDLAINDLIKFFKPYQQYILSGQDAAKEMDKINKQNAQDRYYANQERQALGY